MAPQRLVEHFGGTDTANEAMCTCFVSSINKFSYGFRSRL